MIKLSSNFPKIFFAKFSFSNFIKKDPLRTGGTGTGTGKDYSLRTVLVKSLRFAILNMLKFWYHLGETEHKVEWTVGRLSAKLFLMYA